MAVYPLSDRENVGGWVLNEDLSDEFDGAELDGSNDLVGAAKGEWVTVSQTFSRQMPSTARDRLRLVIHDDDVPPGTSTLYLDDISIIAMDERLNQSE